MNKFRELLSDKVKRLNFLMSTVIFLVTLLEVVSWRLQEGKAATITDVGNNYLVYYYPLITTITIWLFSFFFFGIIFLYNACIYTQLVRTMYFFVQTVNILAFTCGFGMQMYEIIAYPILLFGIIILTLTMVTRWFLR